MSETMTLVGKDPSNFSSALKKKKKILPELAFKYILSSKVGPVVHQHIWLPNHVGREPAKNVLISISSIPIKVLFLRITKFEFQVYLLMTLFFVHYY